MSFPLDLAMFSLLLFRTPVEYNYDVHTIGVPQFNSNEYINVSLLFQSFDDMYNSINGNVIETQLGMSCIAYEKNNSTVLYFYRLNIMFTFFYFYLKYNYSHLNDTNTKIDTSSFVHANYTELFKIEFNLHAPRELYIDFVVDETFGSSVYTRWFLNNIEGRKSHYYDYYYVFNVDYAYYEGAESISSIDNNTWYKFNLKTIFNSHVNNNEDYFDINLITLNVHNGGNTEYGYITQLYNYICFKNNINFSQVSYDSGYIDGYNVGKNETVDQSLWIYSFTRSVFNGFAQVLIVEILPNIRLGYLIAIPLVLSVLRFILGFFKGDLYIIFCFFLY